MLSWRSDHGVSGVLDPDSAEDLIELILSEGFLGSLWPLVV